MVVYQKSKEAIMFSDAHKSKMSESASKRCTEEWRAEKSEAYRTKIDDELLAELYAKGHTQQECAEKLNVSRKVVANAMGRLGIKARVAAKRDQIGPKNTGWKGRHASVVNKHKRLYRAFGQPSKCNVCGTEDESKTYDWANLTGDYDDPKDFERMCRSCHRKYDNARKDG